MPEFRLRRVQMTQSLSMPDAIRGLNDSLELLVQLGTENWWYSYPQVDATIIVNTTQLIWIPMESYRIESIAIRASTGTASATPRINGVAMGVTGGTPIAVTNAVVLYTIPSANIVESLDSVDVVVTGLVASNLCLSLGVRRVG